MAAIGREGLARMGASERRGMKKIGESDRSTPIIDWLLATRDHPVAEVASATHAKFARTS